MKVGINGTRSFSDYNIFLRAMRVMLSDFDKTGDSELIIYSAGPAAVNSFATEFTNITERSMKARGINVKLIKLPPKELKSMVGDLSYFAFFCVPKEYGNDIVREAEDKDVEVGIFRF